MTGALAAGLLASTQLPAAQAADGYQVAPVVNPDLSVSCGLDVVLALDTSYSIVANGALDATRAAALELVRSFDDKNTDVGIVRFSDSATVAVPLTRATSQTTAKGGVHEEAIYNYKSGNATDWQAAAKKIKSVFDHSSRPSATRLVIFLTDGAANQYTNGNGQLVKEPAATLYDSVDAATKVVNTIKSSGTHILAIGTGKALGTDPQTVKYQGALMQISGTDVVRPGDTFSASTTDLVLQEDLSALQTQFRQLAKQSLNGPKCSFLAVSPKPATLTRGGKYTVTGRLTSPGNVPIASQQVVLQSRAIGASSWSTLKAGRTDAQGKVSVSVKAKKNREYRGTFAGNASHNSTVSGVTRVTVTPHVKLAVHTASANGGVRIEFTGRVKPKSATTKVFMESKVKKGTWQVRKKKKVDNGGHFSMRHTAYNKAKWRISTKASKDFGVGRSEVVKVKP